MPQKFLSIRNLEKYQTNRNINPPWFKIHRTMFGDPAFIQLTPAQRFLYIGLIHLAVESGNRIYNCSTFIGQRLYIHHTEVDLRPLYKSGFLYTSNLSRVLSETEERRERVETEENGPQVRGEVFDKKPQPRLNGQTCTLPDDFIPNDRAKELAKGQGQNVFALCAAFKDHHAAKGSVFKDWQAAFRTWLRNDLKFKEARR